MSIAAGRSFPAKERRTKEEMESIQAFQLPKFVPSYPHSICPHADKARAEAYAWSTRHGLDKTFTPEELEAFIKADIPGLPMVTYVDMDEAEAVWAGKYFLWTFAFDDHLDRGENFFSPENIRWLLLELNVVLMCSFPDSPEMRKNFMTMLDEGDISEKEASLEYVDAKLAIARLHPGTVYDTSASQTDPLCKAFRELWLTMWEATRPEFMYRWGLSYQRYILSNMTEVMNRNRKVIPSVDEYIAMRRNTAAVELCLVIVEFRVDVVNLPDSVFYTPEMQRMILAINDFVSWLNDMWSFKKEVLHGDVHNLVFVVSHAQGCSYQEAGNMIHQMILGTVEDLEKAAADLDKVTPAAHKHAASRYVRAAQNWVSGGYFWHDKTPRYKVT